MGVFILVLTGITILSFRTKRSVERNPSKIILFREISPFGRNDKSFSLR